MYKRQEKEREGETERERERERERECDNTWGISGYNAQLMCFVANAVCINNYRLKFFY